MTMTMKSADGTTIAYQKAGSGPAVIVVGGAFNTRHSAADIAPLLAAHFAVYTYDRRGRGDSTDAGSSAGSPSELIAREIEDLAALIDATGGSAAVYGHSSGGVIGLEAAAVGIPIAKLAAYEPPLVTPDPSVGSADEWRASIRDALDANDRDHAARLFLQGTGTPQQAVDGMSQQPWWPGMLSLAHTLPFDVAAVGEVSARTTRYAAITAPTLLLSGGDSDWAADVAAHLERAIPNATSATIQGQGHNVDAATVAPVLTDFFLS